MEQETESYASPNAIFQKAADCFLKGEIEESDQLSRQLLDLEPHHPMGLFLRGMILNETCQRVSAVPFLEQAIALDPTHFSFQHYLGVILKGLNEDLKAREYLKKACDWRWMANRTDSPWYPSARLFRQTRYGDWGELIQRVRRGLEDLVEARKKKF